jgi:predicted aminopeptidase
MTTTKKVLLALLILLVGLGFYYRDLLRYGYMQARGQASILLNTRPITKVLADKSFPDSLKTPLRLIGEIKQFAIDSLGLDSSGSYTELYDQQGLPILWVLTASERYKLAAKEWTFPIIGRFSYKGYFDSTRANAEQKQYIAEGFDTQLNEVSAWSTLGYLDDPVLSSMLYRSEGQLANLISHELTHGTVFVKNNLELNENLASFVGDFGAVWFLNHKFGKNSAQLKRYEFQKKYGDAYSQHILKGAKQLDSLYASKNYQQRTNSLKDSLKTAIIQQIMTSTDTLLGGLAKKYRRGIDNKLPNNAFFIGYLTYKSKQNDFKVEFEQKFKGNFANYLKYLKTKYPTSF